MTEIRTIRHQEADAFLRLMCDSFELDLGRARSVFFTEPYFDLERKWALFEAGEMVSILTLTPLLFGWGPAIGVAGVATRESARRQGLAARLIRQVVGDRPAVLFARDERLYETLGFTTVDRVVRGLIESDDDWESLRPMAFEEVQAIYTSWSEQDVSRLRRDEQRWRHWQWHYRVCADYQGGYLASEPSVLREAIFEPNEAMLPLPYGSEWYGLSRVREMLGIPLLEPIDELHVMTFNCPRPPVMFMTDQF